MNTIIAKVKAAVSAMSQSIRGYYGRHRLMMLSGITIFSILLIVWARFGFTLQFGESQAGLNITLKADKTEVDRDESFGLSWTVGGLSPMCALSFSPTSAIPDAITSGQIVPPIYRIVIPSIKSTVTFKLSCPPQGSESVTVKLKSDTYTCLKDPNQECVNTCSQLGATGGTCPGPQFCCAKKPPITATLSASPTTAPQGGTVKLTWTSTGATKCTDVYGVFSPRLGLDGAPQSTGVGVDGKLPYTGTSTHFTLQCSDAAGNSALSQVDIALTAASPSPTSPPPTKTPTPSPSLTPTPTSSSITGTIDPITFDSSGLTGLSGQVSSNAKRARIIIRQGPDGVLNSSTYPDWNGTDFIATRTELDVDLNAVNSTWSYSVAALNSKLQPNVTYTVYLNVYDDIDLAQAQSTTWGVIRRSFVFTPTPTTTPTPTPTPTPTTTTTPTTTPISALSCAPVSQTVNVGQAAYLSASGGNDSVYYWQADGQARTGSQVSFVFTTAGAKQVVVTTAAVDGNTPQAVCMVNVVTPAPTGGVGTVQTGPGDAVVMALLVSGIVTLLYVSYTHTSMFRRREIDSITRKKDPLDFRG